MNSSDMIDSPEFVNGILEKIRKYVYQFATIGGHYQENKDLIEDMIQEASMAVLHHYGKHPKGTPFSVDALRRSIFDACRRTILNARTISIPERWIRMRGADSTKEYLQDKYICHDYSAIEEFALPSEYLVPSFEDDVTNRILVADLFRRASEKERKIYRLTAAGFTSYEIERIFGIDHKMTSRCLNRARRYLTIEKDKTKKKKSSKGNFERLIA